MGVHSGKFGVVNGVSTVRNWTVTDSRTLQAYVASNTKFGTGRRCGVESWSGGFGYYGHTPPVMPGESFTFLGYTAPDDDVSGVGLRYTGTSLVENVQISWGWQGGEIISAQSNFQGHLALTIEEPGAEILDETVPIVPCIVGTKIEYSSDLSDWTEWTNLLSAQLTISSAIQAYVNSSTVVDDRLWTGRRSGPIDWTLSVTEQDVTRARFAKGDTLGIRLYVSATEYWELVWAKVGDFTGLTVDRETGAIMQQTVNLSMDGFDPDAGSYTASVGRIVKPDETVWWGEAAATTTAAPTTTL